MTKRHHRCDETCEIHKELTDKVKKKTRKVKTPKYTIFDDTLADMKKITDEVQNDDVFVCLQDCLKKLIGIKKDHGY